MSSDGADEKGGARDPEAWGMAASAIGSDLRDAFDAVRLVAFDFDGVMTDNRVFVDQSGQESVVCSRYDGLGLGRLTKLGILTCIVSTEVNPVVSMRAQKLKIDVRQGVDDKVEALSAFASEAGVTLAECAYVGNDINDSDVLRAVGLPIVVLDAHPSVLPYARYRLSRAGGRGAVREICDLIADVRERRAGTP